MNKEVSTFHSGKYLFSINTATDHSVLTEAENVFLRMPIFPDTLFSYKENMLEKAIFNETGLEGSNVTLKQVCGIIKHDRSNFSQDTQAIETINLYMTHSLINSSLDKELSPELIGEIHDELVTGLSGVKDTPGHYRKGGPKADSKWLSTEYTPPASTLDVNFLIKHLIEWLEDDLKGVSPVIKAFLLHLHLKKIQPYCNANAHTARLTETWYLRKHKIKLLPHLLPAIYNSDREGYYKSISEFYDTSDISSFIDFVSGSLKETVYAIRDENFDVMSGIVSSHYLTKLYHDRTLNKRQYELLCLLKDEKLSFRQEDLQLRKPFVKLYGNVSRTTVSRDMKKFEELDLICPADAGFVFNHDTLKNI